MEELILIKKYKNRIVGFYVDEMFLYLKLYNTKIKDSVLKKICNEYRIETTLDLVPVYYAKGNLEKIELGLPIISLKFEVSRTNNVFENDCNILKYFEEADTLDFLTRGIYNWFGNGNLNEFTMKISDTLPSSLFFVRVEKDKILKQFANSHVLSMIYDGFYVYKKEAIYFIDMDRLNCYKIKNDKQYFLGMLDNINTLLEHEIPEQFLELKYNKDYVYKRIEKQYQLKLGTFRIFKSISANDTDNGNVIFDSNNELRWLILNDDLLNKVFESRNLFYIDLDTLNVIRKKIATQILLNKSYWLNLYIDYDFNLVNYDLHLVG